MNAETDSTVDRCPHCGVVADVERASRLIYRCRVCGGPRVPLGDASVTRSGKERKALKAAQRLRFKHAAWLIAAGAVGGLGALSLLVTLGVLLVVTPGLVPTVAALLAAALPLGLAGYAAHRARGHARELETKLGDAWRAVATDILNQHTDPVDAEHLGRALRLEDEEVERLLTDLEVHDVVRTRVTDDGALVYEPVGAPPRVRVKPDSRPRVAEGREPVTDAEAEDVPGEQLARREAPP